jgi:hypothetical protein
MFCDVCKIAVLGRDNYEKHLNGQKHAVRVDKLKDVAEKMKEGGDLYCQVGAMIRQTLNG